MGSSVGAGSKHTVFNYGNQLRCVGANNRGQLGAGNTDFYSVPAIIEGFSGVSWVTAGTDFSGCIAEDTSSSKNTVYMWGANKYGQLGDGTIKDKWSPVKVNIPVEEEETPLKISAGANHTLCATATRIYAWGCNRSGQLGNGGVEDSRYPIEVPIPSEYAGQPVRYISAGTNFSACVIGNDILVWGDNTYGQLGTGDFEKRLTPVLLQCPELSPEWDGLERLPLSVAVSAGGGHLLCCAFYKDIEASLHYTIGKTIFMGCGRNDYGQLGLGHTDNLNDLTVIQYFNYTEAEKAVYDVIPCVGAGGLHSVFMTGRHTVGSPPDNAVTPYVSLSACGCGRWGQSGDSNRRVRVTPQSVTGKHSFYPEMWNVEHYDGRAYITAGGAHSIVNAFYPTCAWGDNSLGQLGTGIPTGNIIEGNVYEAYPVILHNSYETNNPITFFKDPSNNRVSEIGWSSEVTRFWNKTFSTSFFVGYDDPIRKEGRNSRRWRQLPKYVMCGGGGNIAGEEHRYYSGMIELPDFLPDFDELCFNGYGGGVGIVDGEAYKWNGIADLNTQVTKLEGDWEGNVTYVCRDGGNFFVIADGVAYVSSSGTPGSFAECDTTYIGSDKVVKVVAARYTTCLLTESGKVYSFGINNEGLLGQGDDVLEGESVSIPTPIAMGDMDPADKVSDIVCGDSHYVCRTENDKLYGWGSNQDYQYTQVNSAAYNGVPKRIYSERPVKVLCAGGKNTAVIYEGYNGVYACGSNYANVLNFIPGSTKVSALAITALGSSVEIVDIMKGGTSLYCIDKWGAVRLANGTAYNYPVLVNRFLNITGSSSNMCLLDYRNNIRQGQLLVAFKFPGEL